MMLEVSQMPNGHAFHIYSNDAENVYCRAFSSAALSGLFAHGA